MIETAVNSLARGFQPGEVRDEAVRRKRLATHRHLDPERMAMQAAVLVSARQPRETVGGVEPECVADLEMRRFRRLAWFAGTWCHGMPISLWVCSDRRQRG